ncbi:MAG: hypothetical protein PHT02_13745, partial [Tissierellia bacterium]|nr:hypothetical protein [Tissierellia bacterium]
VRRRVCAEIPIDIDVDAVGGNACVNLVATSEEGCQGCPPNGVVIWLFIIDFVINNTCSI